MIITMLLSQPLHPVTSRVPRLVFDRTNGGHLSLLTRFQSRGPLIRKGAVLPIGKSQLGKPGHPVASVRIIIISALLLKLNVATDVEIPYRDTISLRVG